LKKIEEYEVCESLETLERRYRLVQEQGTKQVCAKVADFYRFVHRFFREHIYNQLSKGKRRILHKQMGECLESLYAERSHIAGQLAFHFKEAHEILKAAQYALMAAQFEQSRYSWAEVKKCCEFGLFILKEIPPNADINQLKLNLIELLGDSFFESGKCSQASQYYQEALCLAKDIQVKLEQIVRLYLNLANNYEVENRLDKMIEFITQAKEILDEHVNEIPYNELHVKLEWLYAVYLRRKGETESVVKIILELLEKAETLSATSSLGLVKSYAYNTLANVLGDMGKYDEALANYQKAIEFADKINNKNLTASFLTNLSITYKELGNFVEGLSLTSQAFEIALQVGNLDDMLFAKAQRGFLLLDLEKPSEALEALKEAESLVYQTGSKWYISSIFANMSLAYNLLDNLNISNQYAHKSISEAEKNEDIYSIGYVHNIIGQAQAPHDWKLAEQHFNKAISTFDKIDNRYWSANTRSHLAELLLKKGEKQKAIELLQTAMTTFKELNLAHEIEKMQKVLKNAEVLK